jgi:mRNA interferase RelE/StbE
MRWKIEIKPSAEKQYLKLDRKTRQRIKQAMLELEKIDDPVRHPGVRLLTGKLHGDFRLRIGKWRVLFTPDEQQQILRVYAIIPRWDAYK